MTNNQHSAPDIPERLFAKPCHPERPNQNCSWSVSKEPVQGCVSYVRADLLQPVPDEKRLAEIKKRYSNTADQSAAYRVHANDLAWLINEVEVQQPPAASERCGECETCHHNTLNQNGTCIESVLSVDGLHVEICGCKCVIPAPGATDEHYDARAVIQNYISTNERNLREAATEYERSIWSAKLDTCRQIRESLPVVAPAALQLARAVERYFEIDPAEQTAEWCEASALLRSQAQSIIATTGAAEGKQHEHDWYNDGGALSCYGCPATKTAAPAVTPAVETHQRTYRDRWCDHCQTTHRYFTSWTIERNQHDQLSDLQAEQHCVSQTLPQVGIRSDAAEETQRSSTEASSATKEEVTQICIITTPGDAAREAARAIFNYFDTARPHPTSPEWNSVNATATGKMVLEDTVAAIIARHFPPTAPAPAESGEVEWLRKQCTNLQEEVRNEAIAVREARAKAVAECVDRVRAMGQEWYGQAKARGAAFSDKGRLAEQIAAELESLAKVE